MILIPLIKSEHDMDQAIHGVNNQKNKLKSIRIILLTFQIVIINISTALLGLFLIIFFNFFLFINNQNIENQKNYRK